MTRTIAAAKSSGTRLLFVLRSRFEISSFGIQGNNT
jgi:hypothetical protein